MSCTGAWRQGFCRYHQPEECQRPGVSGIIHSARQLFVSLVPPFSLAKEQMNRPCNQYSHQCSVSLTNKIEVKRWNAREHLVYTLGPLNVPTQYEAIIEVPHKRLLIGSAHSKDLTCVPGGSLMFSFAFSPHACLWVRKLLGHQCH